MRTSQIAVIVAVAVVGPASACFRTAPYDTAHARRVVSIQARYEAETRRQGDWYAARVAALDQLRASVIANAPGVPYAPMHRVDAGWVTSPLSTSTSAGTESLLSCARNQTALHAIDQQLAAIATRQDESRRSLAHQRDLEIRASVAQRDSEIASGRAAHRARVRAAATAFAAKGQTVPALELR